MGQSSSTRPDREDLASIAAEVIRLRRDLEAYKAQQADGVTTRGLRVVDHTGFERVRISATLHGGMVMLAGKPYQGHELTAVLSIHEEEQPGPVAALTMLNADSSGVELEMRGQPPAEGEPTFWSSMLTLQGGTEEDGSGAVATLRAEDDEADFTVRAASQAHQNYNSVVGLSAHREDVMGTIFSYAEGERWVQLDWPTPDGRLEGCADVGGR